MTVFGDGQGIGSGGFPIGRQGLANNYSYLSCTLLHLFTVKAVFTKMQMPKIESMKTRNPNPRKAKVTATGTSSDEIYNGLLVELCPSKDSRLQYTYIYISYHVVSCIIHYHSQYFQIILGIISSLWDFAVYMTHMANKFYY